MGVLVAIDLSFRRMSWLADAVEKRTEELRENEALLRKIAENYPNSYLSIVEEDLTVGFTSGQEFKKQNLDPDQFIGLTLEQVFGDQSPVVRQYYLKTFAGEEQSFELFLNDQYQYYRTVPLYAPDGMIARILSVVENITERKRAEEALRESEERYRNLFETVPVGINRTTPEGQILDANQALIDILKYPDKKTLLKVNVKDLYLNPQDRIQWQERIVQEQVVQGIEAQYHRYDGNTIWARTNARAIFDEDGQVQYYEGSLEDITERKLAEENLRDSEEKFRMLASLAPAGVYLTNSEGHCTYANQRWLEMAGMELNDALGFGWVNGLHPDDRELVKTSWYQSQSARTSWENEYRFQSLGKKTIWVYALAAPLFDTDQNLTGYIGVNWDITERKQAEIALKNLNESLDERVRERTYDLNILVGAMAGREVRMAELKKVIKKLRKQLQEAGIAPIANDPLAQYE